MNETLRMSVMAYRSVPSIRILFVTVLTKPPTNDKKRSLVESIWQRLEAHNVLLLVVPVSSAQPTTEEHQQKICLKQCL